VVGYTQSSRGDAAESNCRRRTVLTSACTLVPLWDRAGEWGRRLAMIRQAASFLYLSTYYIEADSYGTELLGLLLEAQQRGVAVNLLIDGFGQLLGGVLMSPAQKAQLAGQLAALRAAGATVSVYRPAGLLQRRLGGGQHVKIQVSEAGDAIFGSSNITRSSFERWNEYSVALGGPVAAVLLDSYAQIGGVVADAHLRHLRALSSSNADIELNYWICNPNLTQGRSGPLWWRGVNPLTDRLVEMIDAAGRSVLLTSFYFKPVEPLLSAFERAARRGVRVEVFHSHRDALPATDLAWIAAAASYPRLLKAGVTLYENHHGEHSKILLIDDRRVAFGSYNFEEAAHDRLAEAMFDSVDPHAVAPAAAIFAQLRGDPDNEVVTRRGLSELPASLQLKRALLGRFKRWM
jgi:cardiolipin synthase A/B